MIPFSACRGVSPSASVVILGLASGPVERPNWAGETYPTKCRTDGRSWFDGRHPVLARGKRCESQGSDFGYVLVGIEMTPESRIDAAQALLVVRGRERRKSDAVRESSSQPTAASERREPR